MLTRSPHGDMSDRHEGLEAGTGNDICILFGNRNEGQRNAALLSQWHTDDSGNKSARTMHGLNESNFVVKGHYGN